MQQKAAAQSADSLLEITIQETKKRLQLEVYGSMNLHFFNWEIWPEKRNEVDFERAVIEGSFHITPKFALNAELEFEHGGTGVAVEFDRFEEFGEFEYEVEKGGEVRFEEFNLSYDFSPKHRFEIGYVKVPFGLITFRDEPEEYFTNTLPYMENVILPTDWAEYGLMYKGKYGNWRSYAGLITSLESTGFSSANFIKRGNQKRFETVNANDWAGVARLDYEFGYEKAIGVSAYVGNSRNNRPKPDLQVDAYVSMADFHVVYEVEPFEFVGQLIYGRLQNSELVSIANRNLSNNLNVKRTPVASSCLGYSAELGFELFDVLKKHPNGELIFFLRYDFVDTMLETQGQIYNNPRWQSSVISGGINYQPIPQVVFKAQYSYQKLGIDEDNQQQTASLGFGFHF